MRFNPAMDMLWQQTEQHGECAMTSTHDETNYWVRVGMTRGDDGFGYGEISLLSGPTSGLDAGHVTNEQTCGNRSDLPAVLFGLEWSLCA